MRALALLLISSIAYADPPAAPVSPLKSVPEASLSPLRLLPSDLDRIEHRARVRRAVGIGLTVPGVVLVIFGGVLIGLGTHNDRVGTAASEIAAGAVATGIGVVFTVPGAYLWIDGQDSLDTAAWRRRGAMP